MNDVLEIVFELILSIPLEVSLSGFALFFILMSWPVVSYVKRTIWRTLLSIGAWSFSGVGVISTILSMLNFAMFR